MRRGARGCAGFGPCTDAKEGAGNSPCRHLIGKQASSARQQGCHIQWQLSRDCPHSLIAVASGSDGSAHYQLRINSRDSSRLLRVSEFVLGLNLQALHLSDEL